MSATNATPLYSARGIRELDARAMRLPGLGGGGLMEAAGLALWRSLCRHFPRTGRIGVLCGPGNNGGDGFVLARLAGEAGYPVFVHAPELTPRSPDDARRAREAWCGRGGEIRSLESFDPHAADVWVDCLFGIGMQAAPRAPYDRVIEILNRSGQPVLAADIPSGVDADTGNVPGIAVRATHTVTMLGEKPGLWTGSAVDCVGEVEVADLGLPPALREGIEPLALRLAPVDPGAVLPPCRRSAHKGDFGHVVVLGGAPGYSGAARLAARAALRAGAGLVTLLTHPEHAALANLDRPELMVRAVRQPADLHPWLEAARVMVVGPGLGLDAWGQRLWTALADSDLPMVVDADALNWLARFPRKSPQWILTPHPGEAGRLLGVSAGDVNADRLSAVRMLQRQFGGVVLLKGAGTLVCGDTSTQGGSSIFCLDGGDPGMATAGMGDVLSGLLGALLARGVTPLDAACHGGNWHIAAARAALLEHRAERGVLAAEVADRLPAILRPGGGT